jgi:hypothetical protein
VTHHGDDSEHDSEHDPDRDEERAHQRADSVPEESAAGADDPEQQAAAVLADSDQRVEDPEGTRADSTQTLGP